jgi:hypothetical protein
MNLEIYIKIYILNKILMYMLRKKRSNPLQSNYDMDL